MDKLLHYVDERVQGTVGQLGQRGAVVHERQELSHTNTQTKAFLAVSTKNRLHITSRQAPSLTYPLLHHYDEELHGEAYQVSRVKAVPQR